MVSPCTSRDCPIRRILLPYTMVRGEFIRCAERHTHQQKSGGPNDPVDTAVGSGSISQTIKIGKVRAIANWLNSCAVSMGGNGSCSSRLPNVWIKGNRSDSPDKSALIYVHNYLWLTEKLGHRARPRSFKTDITSTGSFSLRCGLHGLTRYSADGTERT